jgi:hypothetical protein
MSGGFDDNTKVVSLCKFYTSLETGEHNCSCQTGGLMNLNMWDRCGVDRIKWYISLRTTTSIT